MSRTVWKHLASSKRSWMFTMVRRLGGAIEAAAEVVREADPIESDRPTPHDPGIRFEPLSNLRGRVGGGLSLASVSRLGGMQAWEVVVTQGGPGGNGWTGWINS